MSTLGIDIGTTGCKVAAYSEDGRRLGLAYRGYAINRPAPGWCELPARDVWRKLQSAIREVAAATAGDPVTALCVSSIGEAVTPVDCHGTILADCILSSDSRGGEYSAQLLRDFTAEAFYQINPNIISPNYSYPKIAWIRDHQPEVYQKTDTFLLWDGLVSRLLGGADFASFSLANRTLLFDIRREDWSSEILARCNIARDKLPLCMPAGRLAGEVSPAMACELGLPRGVKIVVGGHDQSLNALGLGIVEPGPAALGLGTYECITPVYAGLARQGELLRIGLNAEHYVLPGMYVSFLFNQAGSLIQWFRSAFARELPQGQDELLQSEMPEDPTDLMVLPYFEPTGSPGYVNDASGVILGLKMHTTRGEILKAVMEGASFYFLDTWRQICGSQPQLIAGGGGAKSDRWLQIKADIFGVPVSRPQTTECGAMGAAMLAAAATGGGDLTREIRSRVGAYVNIERIFEPDGRRHRLYLERSGYYASLFPALREKLSEWHQLTAAARLANLQSQGVAT